MPRAPYYRKTFTLFKLIWQNLNLIDFFIISIIVFLATSPFILPPPSSDSYGSARRSNEPINMRYPSNVTSLGRIEGGEVFDSSFFCSYCSMVIAPLSQVKPLCNLLIRNNNTFTRISHYCSKFIYSQISLFVIYFCGWHIYEQDFATCW